MMRRRPFIGRRLVRTAAVGGVAYAAGHHVASSAADNAAQDARITDLEQQQTEAAPPAQPAYQPPPPPQAAAPSPGISSDALATLKQLGELHESGVLTDAEFESAKQKVLGS